MVSVYHRRVACGCSHVGGSARSKGYACEYTAGVQLKRISGDVLTWQTRRHARLARQTVRNAGFRKHRRRVKRKASVRARLKCIRLPEELRFHGTAANRREFIAFVQAAEMELRSGSHVRIDLAGIKLLYPCGLLLLMAYVHSWLNTYPGRLSASMPQDPVVRQMLQKVELLEKLSLASNVEISHQDVTRWYYFTGTDVNLAKVEPFMDRVRALSSLESQSYLMDCLNEAVTNVRHHAYEHASGEGRTPWWMFATISPESIVVAVHDRGASIPGTLMGKPGVREQVLTWIVGRKKRDARILEAAVNGRSRTKLAYRGKGLPEMLEFTTRTPGGTLGIYSREGAFYHHAPTGDLKSFGLNVDIQGTLILWSLALQEEPT